jgi:uncharacterized protein YoxC
MSTQDFMWLAIGLASLIVAGGLAYVCVRLGFLLTRTEAVLDKAAAKLDQLDEPVLRTMNHVGGIADSVDSLVARVNRVSEVAERAVGVVDKAADAAQASITPAVVRIAGLAAAVTAGARAFFTKFKGNGSSG